MARHDRPLPIRRPDALASGLTDSRLRRTHQAVFRGVHVEGDLVPGLEGRVLAALAVVTPGSYVSHHTAALLWGGVVPDDPDIHVCSPRNRTRRVGIAAHRTKAGHRVVAFRGVRVTSPSQTFLDLAQVLGLVDLVVLGDSLVRAGRTTEKELVESARHQSGPHSRLARRAASLVRSRVDSPMESRVRLLVVLAGLPEPEVDHRVFDADGRLLRRYDLSYLPFRLIIEYDGRHHAESDEQWLGDIGRDEDLDDERIRRLVIVSRDVYSTPARTLSRITKAMRSVGMPVPPLRDDWRRHFPGRPGDLAQPA
ncbi:hypothetical protein [Intrasporangium flavum]|uniref:hypothetical protein n=1 Tax=Intrasporangium flavum TaxID=1428657 RepID=UPI00096CC320|nr:hypothetical protein [Intrasporangium flavum]